MLDGELKINQTHIEDGDTVEAVIRRKEPSKDFGLVGTRNHSTQTTTEVN